MSDEPTEGEVQFRKVPADPNKRGIKKKLSMIQSFASIFRIEDINL